MKELKKLDAVNIDEALKNLRDRLESEKGEIIDFYWGDIKDVWKGSGEDIPLIDPIEGLAPSDAKHFLSLCLAQSGDAQAAGTFSGVAIAAATTPVDAKAAMSTPAGTASWGLEPTSSRNEIVQS